MKDDTTNQPIDADAIRADAEALLRDPGDEGDPEADTPNDTDKRSFPVLSETAYHGLPGEIVRLIEPHTEADNAALLTSCTRRYVCNAALKSHG